MDLGLKDKVALVTGAGSQIGFGKAIALALAGEGCDVAINDVDIEGARQTAAGVEAAGRKALAIKADVTSGSEVDDMVKQVLAAFGKLDILVNNAGACTPPKPFLEMTDAEWNRDIAVNLGSTMYCTRAVLPHMISRKQGRIINLTSGAGMHGGLYTNAYAAAKAGILAFTRGVAKEAATSNILINCISPGIADTGFAKNAPPGLLENFVKTVPLGRLTEPRDIANAALFLASDLCSDMIGQVLIVTGNVDP